MKRILKTVLAVIAQVALAGLFDYCFFAHSVGASSSFCWWFFAAFNLAAISAIVMSVVLRRMETVKMLPSTVLLITVLIEFLYSTVAVIIDYQSRKFSVISALSMVMLAAIAETAMYVIQYCRCKRANDEAELQEADLDEDDGEDEVVEAKVKLKSSALLLLMTYVTDLKKWDNLENMPFVDELTCAVTDCRQYTYEELGEIESEIKALTNALKKYTNNNSVERATATAGRIIDLLARRETEIDKLENDTLQ